MQHMITRSERLQPWLDDGNIILAAQGKCFRVHRTILSSYSEVFRDMFAIPHSDNVDEDVVDGCPVVDLQDASADVQIILQALYDRSFVFFLDEPMPIAVLVAFLRLGKKYAIRQLFKEAVRRLSPDVPLLEYASKMSEKEDMTLFPRVSGNDPHNFTIMNIAREIGHLSTVAIVAYYCCIACPVSFIADGYDSDGTKYTLSFPNQLCCLLGQRYIAQAQRKLTLLLTDTKLAGPCRCSRLLDFIHSFHDCRGPFIAGQHIWNDRLCTSCQSLAGRQYDATRTRLWKDFPTHLDLGSWDVLDKDIEILERDTVHLVGEQSTPKAREYTLW